MRVWVWSEVAVVRAVGAIAVDKTGGHGGLGSEFSPGDRGEWTSSMCLLAIELFVLDWPVSLFIASLYLPCPLTIAFNSFSC